MTAKDQFLEIKEKIKEDKKRQKEVMKGAFKEITDELFAEFPSLRSFSWVQYTPYFNDGDECIFSVNLDLLEVNDIDSNDFTTYENINGKYKLVPNKEVDPDGSLQLMAEKIKNALREFDDEDFMFMFGDHCSVLVEEDNIFVEDYDHD